VENSAETVSLRRAALRGLATAGLAVVAFFALAPLARVLRGDLLPMSFVAASVGAVAVPVDAIEARVRGRLRFAPAVAFALILVLASTGVIVALLNGVYVFSVVTGHSLGRALIEAREELHDMIRNPLETSLWVLMTASPFPGIAAARTTSRTVARIVAPLAAFGVAILIADLARGRFNAGDRTFACIGAAHALAAAPAAWLSDWLHARHVARLAR
jgi:hypothetical protein